MKKIFSSITIALSVTMLLFLTPYIEAQSTITTDIENVNGGMIVSMDIALDSIDTVYSYSIPLGLYDDDNFYTYPIAYGYQFTSVTAKPKIFIGIQGSFDETTWTLIDTVSAVTDSTETFNVGTMNLNNKKFPYYRAFIEGKTGNRSDCKGEFYTYSYRKGVK